VAKGKIKAKAKKVVLLVVMLLLSACNKSVKEKVTPGQGTLNGNIYENNAIGIIFEKSSEWEFIENEEFSEFCVQNNEQTIIGLNVENLQRYTFEEWVEREIANREEMLLNNERSFHTVNNVGEATLRTIKGKAVVVIGYRRFFIDFFYEQDGYAVMWRIQFEATQNTSWESLKYEEIQAIIVESYIA